MKNLTLALIFLLLTIFKVYGKEYTVLSPDQNIKLTIAVDAKLHWMVEYKGSEVIAPTAIALEFDDTVFGENPKLLKKKESKIDGIIDVPVPHKDSRIADRANEVELFFKGNFSVVFRAYNDGVAYRFISKSKKQTEVVHEVMNLSFPDQTISLFPQEESMYSHNERFYLEKKLTDISKEDFCSLPVLFKTDEGVNVLFTETAVHSYPMMYLEGSSTTALNTKFSKFVLKAVAAGGNSDRNQDIIEKANYISKTNGNKEFPWRVFVIGDQDKALVESNLTYQLSSPSVLASTDWIKPGKVAWDWYNANNIFGVDFKSGLNQETYQYYIDFASENGIEYVILDEGWTKSTTEIMACNPEIDVAELAKYAEEKNVGLILWVLWKPLDDNMSEILELYKSWGAKGIKVDFMQRSDQTMVESYEAIASECARLEMLVDFHGAFKPSGLRRIYPNVVNYEGVKGSENNKWSDEITPEHNVTIPFIRMVAGPLDYTPGSMVNARDTNFLISFERPMSLGTRCHQLAMYVVYEAPLQMMCENPSIYKKEQECVDFISAIPTTWDETRVLEGKVGDYIVVARRKGADWYVGGMTDWDARKFDIGLEFLGDGDFSMQIMKDGINADKYVQDYKLTKIDVNAKSIMNIDMASGGGWAAIIKKK